MNSSKILVPFVNLGAQYATLSKEILELIDSISRRGNYILGPEVAEFEGNFASFCGVSYAVSLNSGGDALFLSLLASGISSGDEVITAPNSFVASAWSIAHTGARVVFSDVDETYNLNPALLEKSITSRTKAIMPVHLTGRPAAMREICAVAKRHNLIVIEDAAQAVGAKYHGQRTGSLGDIGCFSLHPLKNLHAQGDGGIVTTNSRTLAEKLIKMRNHGLRNRDECEFWGYNSRLDTIQAAIVNLKLRYIDSWNDRFRAVAARYIAELQGIVDLPCVKPYEECVFHRFVIATPQRDALQAFLLSKGIDTRVNYPLPLHLQPAASALNYKRGAFPVAEKLAKTILSLPIYAEIPDAHVNLVIETVKEFFNAGRG
jgi:dTDP-4-amino-4,6-dideoxygalactose transaminase